jgi:hypothetical protein
MEMHQASPQGNVAAAMWKPENRRFPGTAEKKRQKPAS